MCASKKKLRPGANWSTSSPRARPSSTYPKPSASVYASSCAAVAPASRMWYPETDSGLYRGISAAQYSIRSPMRRRCGSGGNSHSFCAMYSLKMSVCSVPSSVDRSTPCRSAATRYMQKMGTAGPEMVMLVVIAPRSMPAKSTSMSAAESMATPQWPTSPSEAGSSESRPIRVGMSNATDSPPPPAASSILYRWLVCSALPKPENCRMVQVRPR